MKISPFHAIIDISIRGKNEPFSWSNKIPSPNPLQRGLILGDKSGSNTREKGSSLLHKTLSRLKLIFPVVSHLLQQRF